MEPLTRLGSILPLFIAFAPDDRVDTMFAPWDKEGSPGAAVAVIKDGEIVVADGYGNAQIEFDVPITPDTVFHVASVSKQFTAFAICLLAEDGKLSLDDPIQKHVSEVPDFGHTITLRHLLHHTSGMRDQWEALSIAGWRMDDVITTEHVLTMVSNQRELNFPPGERYMYCNTGYTLLAETVARVSGTSFPEFCRQRIFRPLDMTRTHFHDDHQRVVPERAYSYATDGDGFRNSVLSYANAGATSLFTTSIDLLFWLQNFGTGEVGGPEAQAMMREVYVLNDGTVGNYALGISLGTWNGHRTISHSGGDAGFRSHVVWFPDQNVGVAVLANLGGIATSDLAMGVGNLFLGPPPTVAQGNASPNATTAGAQSGKPEAVVVDEVILRRYVGSYRHPEGQTLRVTLENGGLVFRGSAEDPVLASSETEFFSPRSGSSARFVTNGSGEVEEVVVLVDGATHHLKRLSEEPEPPVLTDYVGRYWSEELGTFYDVTVEGDALVASHRRHGRITLVSRGLDAFRGNRWFFGELEFLRGKDERVTGFRLQGGRVKNLLFERK